MTVLRQPNAVSCGAASVEMARLLRTGEVVDQARFAELVLARHDRLTSFRRGSHRQVPWPRALGTPPWAVAGDLGEITGVDHDVTLVRWRRAASYDVVVRGGALYVGDRWLPRHVVLVLPGTGTVYNPSSGTEQPIPRQTFASARLGLGRWDVPWFLVHADPSPLDLPRPHWI